MARLSSTPTNTQVLAEIAGRGQGGIEVQYIARWYGQASKAILEHLKELDLIILWTPYTVAAPSAGTPAKLRVRANEKKGTYPSWPKNRFEGERA